MGVVFKIVVLGRGKLGEKRIKINHVLTGSIAAEVGIAPGDFVLSINKEPVADVFDYRFLITNEELLLEIEKMDGEIWEIEVEKDEYEDLGLEFDSSMMDEAKSCTNQCVFCFIDQMPKGMRETLYFKDDDSRLSFLTGNYVTLTNMKDPDMDRIIKYKMSPINVSVHATDPQLRRKMLKNRFAGEVLEKLKKLCQAGITVNCQIVLCLGLNDEAQLDRTLSDLLELQGVKSISVVPVGITKYRESLFPLRPFTGDDAQRVLNQLELWQEKALHKFNTRLVYPADEFFILAGRKLPEYSYYEDFPQIENGVGLITMLQYEFHEYLELLQQDNTDTRQAEKRNLSIATGTSSFQFIKGMAETLEKVYNVKVHVYSIKNEFFGENVTVTGLLTGQDLVAQLRGRELGEELLISRSMLKTGEALFLDDYTLDKVRGELNIKVIPVDNSGKDFIQKVLGNKGDLV